ncbi:MAG: hemolysin III family protein [Mycoplasmoidaceae bacterium]|nr:MAG: hemolysin III family protein [Mycoplasmoidaceae bacterium]
MAKRIKRKQTVGEEIGNAISHGVMALFGVVILVLLLVRSNTKLQIAGAVIYGLSIISLYVFSCLYHSLPHNFAKLRVMKRFDHMSIYLLIGGTYAPVLLTMPTIQWHLWGSAISVGLTVFIIQWILIIIGITIKAIWLGKYHWVHVIMFLILGWTAVIFMGYVFQFNHIFFTLILIGGLAYTIGVIFYALSKVKWFHFVWHFFTIAGTICHAMAILLFLYK